MGDKCHRQVTTLRKEEKQIGREMGAEEGFGLEFWNLKAVG